MNDTAVEPEAEPFDTIHISFELQISHTAGHQREGGIQHWQRFPLSYLLFLFALFYLVVHRPIATVYKHVENPPNNK